MRRALKITAWTFGSLLALLVLLVAAIFVVGNTQSGRAFIARTTAKLTEGHVRLGDIAGSFPSDLQLARLELSDERGVWLTAEGISLRWSPWDLLTRHIQVDRLEVDHLQVDRRPITKPSPPSTTTPSIPHTDLTRLAIRRLDLGRELAGSPVSLVVTANAHLLSLQNATANIVVQRTSGLGDYELALQFDPVRMDADLKVREPANGPLENILKLPGLGDLNVIARLSGPRTAESVQLELDAGALRGRVQGTLDIPGKSANLSYALNAPEMTPAPDLTWNRISLQGTWRGPVESAVADGHLDIRQLKAPGGTELAALKADLKAAAGLITASAAIDGLVIPGPQPQLLSDSPLRLDASMRVNEKTRPLQLTALHKLFALHAQGATAPDQSLHIELTLPDLTPLAAVAKQSVRGDSNIKAVVAHDSKSTQLTADVDSNITGGAASWVGVLRGRSRLQMTGRMTPQAFGIDRLLFTARTASLSATGTAARTGSADLDGHFALSLSDLTVLSPALAGNLKLSGKVSGPRDSLSTAADLSTTISVRGSPPGTVSASLHADGLPRTPHGAIQAQGDLDGSPVGLNVSLQQEKSDFHAIIHRADWKSVHADGELSAPAKEFAQARGKVTFRIGQLSDLNRLLGSTLQGAIDGNLSMRPDERQSHADFRVEAHDVSTGSLTASAQLKGSGSLDDLHLELAAQSPAIAGQPASVTTASILNMTAHTLRVSTADARFHGQDAHLQSPMQLSFGDGLTITPTRLQVQQAVLEVAGRLSPTLEVHGSLRDVKPELINAFMPNLLAAGAISGDAQLQGSMGALMGHVHLNALGLRSSSALAQGLPAVDVHANADLMGDTALTNVKLAAGSKSQVTLSGHAPLAPTGALDLKLAGNLDLALVNPILEARGRHVTGDLNVDTTIRGTTQDPKVGGSVRLAKANFRDYTQGINLTDIAAQIEGDEKVLRIVNLTAKAAPGTLSATGTANILDPGMPIDIKLTAKNAQPITNNIITANVNADLHASGKAREKLDIGGTVHVNRAEVGIPSGFPPNVAVLDVRRPGEAPPAPPEKPLIISLDITVDAPRQILVTGRGLDAELGGQLRIRGTTDSPQVTGGFDLQRGSFDIASTRLIFSMGRVTFNGAGLSKKLDPTLDFTAQSTLSDNTTATVHITGFADSPKIELSSTPDMPQDEILARLLFGVPAAQLTALQVVQIGAALRTLSGGGGGSSLNPLAKIQKALGLDRLSVGGASNNGQPGASNAGATIEAGRYVSSRVYVGVKESTTGTSQVAVDVDLSKHLKLQTRLGNGTATAQGTTPDNDPGSSVGLAYQFEY